VQGIFEHWATLGPGDQFERHRDWLQRFSLELRQQFDALTTDRDRHDRVLGDLYNMLGSIRGLIDAMANTQAAINQINWPQWTTARF
jgi:hypothetical protein